ncbi:MAG: glycosyltransferase [Candidatus Brocadiia bacterium]
MRVVVLTSMFPHERNPIRGVAVYRRTLALARQCEVKVVSPQLWNGLAGHAVVEGIEVARPRWRRVPKLGVVLDGHLFATCAGRAVAELGERFDFDLIDAHWLYPDGFAAVRLARRLGKPVVLSARGTDVNEYCFRWPLRRFARQALRGATRLVAVSRKLKEKMARAGAAHERIAVIHNGVDTALFRPADRAAARRALGLAPDQAVLLSAGALLATKGFHHLIAGFAAAGVRGRLCIAGEGPYRPALEALSRAKGVGSRVAFLGRLAQKELARWYQAADLFCFASLREGCPNVVLEALACGTPVLSTPVGAVPDLVEEGRDGLLFEPGSAERFAEALAAALAKDWDREAIAARGGRRSWDQVAADYYAVFQQAMADWEAQA